MQICGFYAGILAVTEVGIGSMLHAAKIPFRGQLLSLNQIFLLTKASLDGKGTLSRLTPLKISCVAALLKALSPAGAKFTPMLAIAMQGSLYSLGTLLFGHTLLGRLVGASLSSLWAFCQSLLVSFLILSKDVLASPWMPRTTVLSMIGVFIGIKMVLAIAIAILTPYLKTSWFERYVVRTRTFLPSSKKKKPLFRGAFKEATNPFFVSIMALSGISTFASTHSCATAVFAMTRPFAIAFTLFFCIRLIPLDALIHWLRKKNWGQLNMALDKAFVFLDKNG